MDKRKTIIISTFIFLTVMLCIYIYSTTKWFVDNEVPIPFIDKSQKVDYVSYEDGGQPYGIDAKTMVEIINVIGDRE